MIAASSSMRPSAFRHAPVPALKRGSSSRISTARCAALSALPPLHEHARGLGRRGPAPVDVAPEHLGAHVARAAVHEDRPLAAVGAPRLGYLGDLALRHGDERYPARGGGEQQEWRHGRQSARGARGGRGLEREHGHHRAARRPRARGRAPLRRERPRRASGARAPRAPSRARRRAGPRGGAPTEAFVAAHAPGVASAHRRPRSRQRPSCGDEPVRDGPPSAIERCSARG